MANEEITVGSGNVFADLGVANSEAHQLKAELVMKLSAIIKARGLNQTTAAKLIGISQPDLSRLLRGSFREFSTDRLIRAFTRLHSDIEITIRQNGAIVGEPIHLHAAYA